MGTPSSNDFFAFLVSKPANLAIIASSGLLQVIFIPLAIIGIIWFERFGSNKKRTLINMMVSATCWSVIEFCLIIQLSDLARYITGPMSGAVCFVKTVIRGSCIMQIFLFYNCIALMRYLYIFWLKNPAAFNDDFWFRFGTLWIKGLCTLSNATWYFVAGHQPLNYYICTGIDPTDDFKKPLKIYGLVEIGTILFNVFVFTRKLNRLFDVNVSPKLHNLDSSI